MTTACIVQARMRSTRLPGKVLKRLGDRSALAHVLERCKSIRGVDVVCCATVDTTDCDRIAEEADRCGVAVFRGDEDDVLGRYRHAAVELKADVVMRVTSDCPLLDPHIAANVLDLLHLRDTDYACNNMPASWPHGLDCEAFPFEWLERAFREAVRPSEREHASLFIRFHEKVRSRNLESPDTGLSRHRWTLDTPDDLKLLEAVFSRLPDGEENWRYEVPLGIVQAEPWISEINASHDRHETLKKALEADARQGFGTRNPRQ